MGNLNFQSLFIGIVLLVWSCANPIPPKGGPKDETPPQIDSTKSDPNLRTNFIKQRIEITFDEWIKLDNIATQVVISPPLEKRETIALRGKTIRIDFDDDEILKEDVTYTINFGEAIKDITENNPFSNFRYVFATGSYIDSLELSGTVIDAFTEEPVENATILLYENLEDSVVYDEKPFYFSKTDKSGSFKLENLKSGIFKVVAIMDGNQDKKFSGSQEQIGFLDSPVPLSDTSSANISVLLFSNQVDPEFLDHKANAHVFKFIFNTSPDSVTISSNQSEDFSSIQKISGDTLIYWYRNAAFPVQYYIQADIQTIDTVTIETDTAWKSQLDLKYTGKMIIKDHFYKDSINLKFNQPVVSFDTNEIRIIDSSGQAINYQISIDQEYNLVLKAPFQQASSHQLLIPPGSISGWVGDLTDTLNISINSAVSDLFGAIVVELDNLDSLENYQIRLMSNDNIVEQFSVEATTQFSKKIEGLSPGNYNLQVIEDQNQNKKWDTGNYLKGIYPERIINNKIDNLRANWEMNVTFTWKR